MRTSFLVVLAGSMAAATAFGESAHKGWRATPDKWPPPTNIYPFRAGMRRGATIKEFPVTHFHLQGPFVRVDKPDPPTKAAFKGEYWFRQDSTATVQKVYLLAAGDDGTLTTREIKTTGFHNKPVKGYFAASFHTEEIEFKEGDVFVVALKIDGTVTPVFLRILYVPFEPS